MIHLTKDQKRIDIRGTLAQSVRDLAKRLDVTEEEIHEALVKLYWKGARRTIKHGME